MFKQIMRRVKILIHWLFGEKYDVSFVEIIKSFFCMPPIISANKYIKGIREQDNFIIVNVMNRWEMFYPKERPLTSFKNFLCEEFESYKFHQYERYGAILDKEDVLVDCGASEGFFSLLFSEKCHKVYSIEPDHRSVEAMKRNFENVENIEIIEAAVSDQCSDDFAFENGVKYTGAGKIYKTNEKENETIISVTTLDELFWKKGIHISFIKADLEGFELNMLKGAKQLISEYKPKMSITSYHYKDDAKKIISYIESFEGYKVVSSGMSEFGTPSMIYAWYEK